MASKNIVDVVDDDELVRDSIKWLLEDEGYSVRTHGSAERLLELNSHLDASCVVVDIVLPGLSGIELLHRMRAERDPLPPVIIVTGLGTIPLAITAMKAGAVDFLEKPVDPEALLNAVKAAFAIVRTGRVEDEVAAARRHLQSLTPREIEVLELLVEGYSNKLVAERLGVSHRTVEFHRSRIVEKTGSRGLANLVRLWLVSRSAT